jgi:hypothetical protein
MIVYPSLEKVIKNSTFGFNVFGRFDPNVIK